MDINNREEYFSPDNITRLLRAKDWDVEVKLREEYFPMYTEFVKSLIGNSELVPEFVENALSELVKRIRDGYQTANYMSDWYKLIGEQILERLYPVPDRVFEAPQHERKDLTEKTVPKSD